MSAKARLISGRLLPAAKSTLPPRSRPDPLTAGHARAACPSRPGAFRVLGLALATPRRTRPTSAPDANFRQPIGRVDHSERLKRTYNASHLDGRRRRRRQLPDFLQARRGMPSSPAQAATTAVQHERQPVASPTRSHTTSSLIQPPTTTAKTCRPNRGRSTDCCHQSTRYSIA
jgi:hypothetical protein